MVVQPNLFGGPDATPQAPDMPDLLLHESAIALLRAKLKESKPASLPWKETIEQWTQRMHSAMAEVNKECDLRRLCCEFPQRLQAAIDAGGDCLKK